MSGCERSTIIGMWNPRFDENGVGENFQVHGHDEALSLKSPYIISAFSRCFQTDSRAVLG